MFVSADTLNLEFAKELLNHVFGRNNFTFPIGKVYTSLYIVFGNITKHA